MKLFLLASLLCCAIIAQANTFYISASGNDAGNGLSPFTAWKTITKVNSTNFAQGDVILFNSGDTFYGTLTTKVNDITFGAYGSGTKPVISGLTTISSWTSLGGNIWEATVPGGLSTLNMVLINGVLTPMGRYPNLNTTNGGYLTYESFVQDKSLTDNQLSSTPNWTGGEVVFRRMDYTMDRAIITNHSGTTINFSTYAGPSMNAGYGYFIENHLSTLDQNGEWFYDVAAKKIKMYYTATPPSIQVATLLNLVNMVFTSGTMKSNVTFKGLSFKGSEGVMMSLTYCKNIMVDNCDFSFAGINAIEYGNGVTFLTIQNSTLSDINMVGIQESSNYKTNDITIQNNLIKKIGLNAGMISNAYGQGTSSIGINAGSGNLLIKENVIDQIGFDGISIKLNVDNQIIRKNVISNFCSVKNDGGGIYNVGQRGAAAASNIIIDSNIISKDVGAMAGTNSITNRHTRGIYLDATSVGVKVLNNTVFDCWDGIYLAQGQNNTVKGNTVYNTGNYKPSLNYFSGALVINDDNNGYAHNSNNIITNNIFFAKSYDQLLYQQTDVTDNIGSIGLIDNNYYVNPWTDMPLYLTNTTSASRLTTYSLPLWNQAFPNYDKNSKGTPLKIPQYTYTFVGSNKIPNSTFTSNITGASASSSPTVHSLTWDNTGQITGGGSAKLTSSVTSTNFNNFYEIIGAIDASKKYVLRFKTKGTKLSSFKTYLQQWSGTYPILTSVQAGSVDTAVQQYEIVFSGEHSTQPNAAVYIQFSQNSGSVYIDDVEFYEASVTPTNVDDYILFEYNTTNSPKTISLGAKYIGVDSTVYNGTITVPPYSSKVLIKIGAISAALIADAGLDISLVLPANTTILKGSAVGTVTSYTWTKIAGPAQFSIASPNSASTAINNLATGKYTFELKVTNNAGDSSTATVNVVTLGVLPVTLIDFTASKKENEVQLQWNVSSELNFSHYSIERSANGVGFESIGTIDATNLFISQRYNYTDNLPLQGTAYYRLAMVDKDGTTKFSKILSVTDNGSSSFKVNTVVLSSSNNSIKIAVQSNYDQVMQVVIADVSGRIIYSNPIQLQKGFNELNKKIPALHTGVYYAKMFTNDVVITKALLSQH